MAIQHAHKQTQLMIFGILMLLIPIHFWYWGFNFNSWGTFWQPNDFDGFVFQSLVSITYTGSMPYAIATSFVFAIILILISKKHNSWQTIVLMCLFSITISQSTQVILKQCFAEPRPYVAHLNETVVPFLGYEKGSFYQQDDKTKRHIIAEYAQNPTVRKYMQSDMGYSFPSGHTIFAVSWLLLFVGLLPRLAQMIFVPIMTIWAAAVLYSRVLLGMHYPIDLFASILFAWVIHAFLFAQVLPRLQQRFQTA